MRKPSLLVAGVAVAVAALIVGWWRADATREGEASRTMCVLRVEGMTCGGCEVGVRLAVGRLPGIETVAASYVEQRAEVTYDPARVGPEEIVAAVEGLGYEAELAEGEGMGEGEESDGGEDEGR